MTDAEIKYPFAFRFHQMDGVKSVHMDSEKARVDVFLVSMRKEQ